MEDEKAPGVGREKLPNLALLVLLWIGLGGACLLGAVASLGWGIALWRLQATPLAVLTPLDQRLSPSPPPPAGPRATLIAPVGGSVPTLTPTTQEVVSLSTGALFTPALIQPLCIPLNRSSQLAEVVRVLDGITLEVQAEGETFAVRYIGLSLFSAQDFALWEQARQQNEALVNGQRVRLVAERTQVDEHGFRPRYVLVGALFANLEMVRRGYALAVSQPPDVGCDPLFAAAQERARGEGRGLWASPPTPTRTLIPLPTATAGRVGDIAISFLSYRGTRWQEPEEFVEIRNDSPYAIQLQGWTLQDNQRHVFVFPSFILGPGQYCRVYTNEYHPTSCGFTYRSPSPIWDNEGDCAYLKDPDGNLVDTFCY